MNNKVQTRYNKSIDETEEIRSWFVVSVNRKKVWNIQLWLLEELKSICKKHKIKYYADGGTLLGAVRHKWFIPRDDDIDIDMFREDYDRFIKIVKKELPDYIQLWEYYRWFSRLVDIRTTSLCGDNWNNKEFVGWICIDIFPLDYASKYTIINLLKSWIFRYLSVIISLKESWKSYDKIKWWKKPLIMIWTILFRKHNLLRLVKILNTINKKVLFKWKKVYTPYKTYRFFPDYIFHKSDIVKFENTTICIPEWYDIWLRTEYWNYEKPVIFRGWHNRRYSVSNSWKEIIKTFDKSKSNEENYKNCKDLFTLD